MKEAIDSRKKNFSRTRNSWRIFAVDRLSQMTPILDNSLLSKKDKLSGMIKWGYMNVYILLENTVNQMLFFFLFFLNFFFCFTRRLRHPHRMCSTSNFWLNGLESPNSEAQVAWSNKPTTYTVEASFMMNQDWFKDESKLIQGVLMITKMMTKSSKVKITSW